MTKKNKRFIECLLVFLSVGAFYYLLECAYKSTYQSGCPHWTMFVLAGVVGLLAMLLNDKFTYEMDFLIQILFCTLLTTIFEYIVGILFNYDYSICDYRNLYFQIDGQISLLFSCIWALMFSLAILILDYIEWKVFKYDPETAPYYKIFGKKVFQFKNT